jgi:photosystem II stability/assembly factor-like uncharacterized protein
MRTQIVGNQTGLGRINVIRSKPGSSSILFVGTAGGGLWKSTNKGANWINDPFFDFLSLGVSDIAISESNANVMYVATGDADGLGSSQAAYSVGIVKTTDGGLTWKNTGFSYTLGKYIVTKLIINKNNPDVVIAATNSGIYKSTDGGANFTMKTTGIYFKDMEVAPDDVNTLYASTYGWGGNNSIYKSDDNGETWKSVKSISSCVRIALATSDANPDVVYALVAGLHRGFHSLLKSTDRGTTWVTKSTLAGSYNILGWADGNEKTGSNLGQGEYDLALTVNPGDENVIYTGGVNMWKSTNGGTNWEMISHWYGGFNKPFVHADIHDLSFNNETGFLYSTHDGGIDVSYNEGALWTPIYDGLSITQFYKVSTAQSKDQYLLAGAQDNGTFQYMDGTWSFAKGGDGMDCLVDYSDYRRSYVSNYNGSFYKTATGNSWSYMLSENKTSENGDWVAPITIDPIRPNVLFAGFQSIWKSVDYGNNWFNWTKGTNYSNSTSLTILATAPSDTNTFYASNGNAIYATYDAGKTWKNISSGGGCTGIAVDYINPKKIYISVGGFTDGSKVLSYDGTNWSNLSGNLPNVPGNCIILQKDSPDRIYLGTDVGVYYSDYNSGIWTQYGDNIKNVIITDMEIQLNTKKLIGATYGRGIWSIDLLNCNLTAPQIKANGGTSFCFGDSVELEVTSNLTSYNWSNGSTGKKIFVKESGTYSVYYEDASGCIARSQGIVVTVSVPPALAVTSAGNAQLCEESTLDLNASFGFVTYTWSNGGTTRKITVNTPGKYWVKGVTKDGCSITSKEFEVVTRPKPTKPTIYRYSSKQLQSSPAVLYQWYCNDTILGGQTNRICDIVKLGKFSVTITDSNGCKNSSAYEDVISDVENNFVNEYYKLTPNPTNGVFNLAMQLNSNDNYNIIITNSIGESILNYFGFYNGGEFIKEFDISKFANGVYFIQVNCGSSTYKEKIIKQ